MGTLILKDIIAKQDIWRKKLDNEEQLVGMLAAGVGICADINFSQNMNQYGIDSSIDVSTYRVKHNIPEEHIIKQSHTNKKYGLWMKSDKRFHYDLYAFDTPQFMQGIISMATACEVDFREFIYGLPFDSKNRKYLLAGYLMQGSRLAVDALESDDVEEEERDDENILNPYKTLDF